MFELLFILLLGHLVADMTLQPDSMGSGKNRNRPIDMSKVPPGQKPTVIWPYWLTAHAATHAMVVYLITGLWFIAALELAAHWLIDFCKTGNMLTIPQDQSLHVACKFLWVFLIWQGLILK